MKTRKTLSHSQLHIADSYTVQLNLDSIFMAIIILLKDIVSIERNDNRLTIRNMICYSQYMQQVTVTVQYF